MSKQSEANESAVLYSRFSYVGTVLYVHTLGKLLLQLRKCFIGDLTIA